MLMTREMDYALRILRALYQEGQLSAAAIAQKESMPKARLVSSRRGASGGYVLEESCEALYLGDLFQALGEPVYVNRCQQPGYQCENHQEGRCGLCRELSRVQQVLNVELRKTPLSAMF